MPSMKALETEYSGYRFRSRTEARWAACLDLMEVKWEYEKEGFDLGADGWYLPDFYVTYPYKACRGVELSCWVEIKGSQDQVTAEIIGQLQALAKQTRQPVYLFFGAPVMTVDGYYKSLDGDALIEQATNSDVFIKNHASAGGCRWPADIYYYVKRKRFYEPGSKFDLVSAKEYLPKLLFEREELERLVGSLVRSEITEIVEASRKKQANAS